MLINGNLIDILINPFPSELESCFDRDGTECCTPWINVAISVPIPFELGQEADDATWFRPEFVFP